MTTPPAPAPAAPTAAPPAPAPSAAAPSAPPPTPPSALAAIDVFGSRRVPAAEIIATAGLVAGSQVVFGSEEFSKLIEEATRRVKERYRFAFVEVSPISYFGQSPDAGKVFITIDVVEADDAGRMKFAAEPTGAPADPAGLVAAWLDYERVVWPLLRQGAIKPPFTCKGGWHCALGFDHPDLESREQQFIDQAPVHFDELVTVLRDDHDAKHRAAAAFVLAYGTDRKQVVDALLPSIDDPGGEVRNNAMRVLVMIQDKADTVVVPLAPVLRAMRFPRTTDRNKAAYALAAIAKHASAADRTKIARELGDTLLAMAAMQQPNNRAPAIDILKAISGEDHATDVAAWRAWLDRKRRRK